MPAIMVNRRQKILKLHWLKRPKKVPNKRNLDQKMNDWKPNNWSLYFNFRFSSRKFQSQAKLAKNITYFTIQFCSKCLTHYINLNPLKFLKMYSRNTAKNNIHFKISSKHVSGWCQKSHLHCFISRRQRTAFSKHYKANVRIFMYIPVRKVLFQRRGKLLSRGGLNNFLKTARCFGLEKCFKIFHFNWNFLGMQLFFSIPTLPLIALKR